MMNNGSIQIGKFKLGYRIEGNGIPVMVIGSCLYYPRIFSQHLRKYLQLVFIDHRGFASCSSQLDSSDYTWDIILDDIEHIRKALNLSRVAVIGHSGHGYMALEYAKKYPDAVSQIVLLAMSPETSEQSFTAADRYFQESVCPERKKCLENNLSHLQAALDANPSKAFITRILKFGPMIWYDANFDASDLWRDVAPIPEIVNHLWEQTFKTIDITKGLNRLNIPIFLGLGRYDYWNPPYLWETVRPYFNDLTIRIFEKSAHTPSYEEQELFNSELLQWFNAKNVTMHR